MQQSFDEEEFQPATLRRDGGRDTELTLGPWLLTGLGLGLLGLCAICFLWGYHVGRGRGPAAVPAADATPAAEPLPASSANKPSANPAGAARPVEALQAAQQDAQTPSSAAPEAAPTPAATSASRLPQQSSGPMVQIAAVSHQEDADVLISALRKRGYAASISGDANDALLHVRIGPFASLTEANQWRQKLLNDGYNAIVQP